MPQIETVLKARIPIVSTTEELSYPVGKNRALAKKIDALAKKAKVAVLGTGVNPGFAMDALPIALTGVCERVDSVRIDRVQDARIRRLPFQQKIGSGLTTDQFQKKVDDQSVRHVGLAESVTMIADAFGWKLDKVTDEIKPKIAEATVESEYLAVDPGYVCGIVQDGIGWKDGKPLITLHMEAYLGAPESYDSVVIEGKPRIEQKISGGVHGDVATASITVNSIPKIINAPAGSAHDARHGAAVLVRRQVKRPWLLFVLPAAVLLLAFAADLIGGGGHPPLSALILSWALYADVYGLLSRSLLGPLFSIACLRASWPDRIPWWVSLASMSALSRVRITRGITKFGVIALLVYVGAQLAAHVLLNLESVNLRLLSPCEPGGCECRRRSAAGVR